MSLESIFAAAQFLTDNDSRAVASHAKLAKNDIVAVHQENLAAKSYGFDIMFGMQPFEGVIVSLKAVALGRWAVWEVALCDCSIQFAAVGTPKNRTAGVGTQRKVIQHEPLTVQAEKGTLTSL